MELRAGKVAVVTGAASGIGRALADALASAGLHVVLADVQDDALDARGSDRRARRRDARRGDRRQRADGPGAGQATLDRFGAVHVVCNNAGVGGRTAIPGSARSTAGSGPWASTSGAWSTACAPSSPRHIGGGHIVNTASMAGLLPGFAPAYDASKHAVVAVTESCTTTCSSSGCRSA